jgi:hypothetical protein
MKATILNLTQHATTEPQIADGVADLTPEDKAALRQIITFDSLPDQAEIEARAKAVADLIADNGVINDKYAKAEGAMIGGAMYLIVPLIKALQIKTKEGKPLKLLFSYTARKAKEELSPDGKSNIVKHEFLHAGFVEARL